MMHNANEAMHLQELSSISSKVDLLAVEIEWNVKIRDKCAIAILFSVYLRPPNSCIQSINGQFIIITPRVELQELKKQ